MGNNQSTTLDHLSSSDIGVAVASKGAKYAAYVDPIKDNGIDGRVLASMDVNDDEELAEIFDELEITSKLHRRVLTVMLRDAAAAPVPVPVENGKADEKKEEQAAMPVATAIPTNPVPVAPAATTSTTEFGAATDIGLTVFTAADDLEDFDMIADAAFMNDPKNVYAGVHLLLDDGYQHPLGARYRVTEDIVVNDREMCHFPFEGSGSPCLELVRDESKGFLAKTIEFQNQELMYKGYVLKSDQGARVGAVCVCTSSLQEADASDELWLAQLAMITESQLAQKKALVQRAKQLEESLKVPSSLFVTENLASEEEKAHLPPDFYDAADSVGMARIPINKNDMRQVAAVERMGLLDMDPDGVLAASLTRLLSIGCNLTGMPTGFFSVMDQAKVNLLCSVGDSSAKEYTAIMKFLNSLERPKTDRNGNLFMCAAPRCLGPCNYTIHKGTPYVAKDMTQGDRHAFWRGTFGSYLGVPIKTADGLVVASICFLDFTPRPDIRPALVEQVQSLGLAVEQELENWSLQREIEMMEQEKATQMLHQSGGASGRLRSYMPPCGDVALTIVVTCVEKLDLFWEHDPDATADALHLHDNILRSCCVATNGYEMSSEGGCFKLAFEDQVDAVLFVLQAQEKLYHASWPEKILSLPGAAIDVDRKMRGLRVAMAAHHGPEKTAQNRVSGRIGCSGKTSFIVRSLLEMCQGGQTLVTSDIWSVAGGLVDALGSPQVLDMGQHVLKTGSSMSDGIISKSVLQLVPQSLACSYAIGPTIQAQTKALTTAGRWFDPPIISKTQLSLSFFDSPHEDGVVTIAQVDATEGLGLLGDDILSNRAVAVLHDLVEAHAGKNKGHECRADDGVWVLAFRSIETALSFSLSFKDAINSAPFDPVVKDTTGLVKIGIYQGAFTSMGPHPITGRAQYSGVIMTRVAQVVRQARQGDILVGTSKEDIGTTSEWGEGIAATCLGEVDFGSGPMSLFSCSWGETQAKWRKLAQRRENSRRERRIALLERRNQTSLPRNIGLSRVQQV